MLYIRYFIFYIELRYFNILYRKYIFTYYVRSMCPSIFELSIEIRSPMIGSMSHHPVFQMLFWTVLSRKELISVIYNIPLLKR